MRGWRLLTATAVFVLTGAAAPAAGPAPDTLAVLLRLDPEQSLHGPFRFEPPASEIQFFTSAAVLDAFYASAKCVSPDRRRTCAILDRVPAAAGSTGCLAVLFDSDQPVSTLKAFRVGRGPDAKAARLEAFKGSRYYDGLYFAERFSGDWFRKAAVIDEIVFNDEARWSDRIVAEKCL